MRLIHWRQKTGATFEEKLDRALAALPAGKKLTRALVNRLELLDRGQIAPGESEREIVLFGKLVELGFARKETAYGSPILGTPVTWDIYYITEAGREELARWARR